MKLIFLNRYFYPDISATSQMLSALAFHLAAEGAEVHVIASRQGYEDPSANAAAREDIDGVCVHRIWTSRFGRRRLRGRAIDYLSFNLAAMIELFGVARRGDIVIAMTDPPMISVPAALVARLRGARLVNWLQDVFPDIAERVFIPLGIAGDVARILRNFSLRRAAANVVLGDRMRDKLLSISGVAPVRVIHNWADGTVVEPVSNGSNPLREEWGLSGKFVVAYSGNMGRAHEFETILNASKILRADERIVFLFIGGGHHREQLEKLAGGREIRVEIPVEEYQLHPEESIIGAQNN